MYYAKIAHLLNNANESTYVGVSSPILPGSSPTHESSSPALTAAYNGPHRHYRNNVTLRKKTTCLTSNQ